MTRLLLAATMLALAASGSARAEDISLTGAGATFPYPLYSKWFAEYLKKTGDVKVNYQSIGSGGGIKQITERTVDFGASDAPMNEEEMKKAGGGLLHIPTCLGAVVVITNLPGDAEVKLSPDVVAKIFLGKITKWNDPAIVALNKGVKLTDTAITVVHRSDGSGTTSVFTDYLTKISPEWKAGPGPGKSVNWPTGLGGKGNEGVAGTVKSSPGSIGYVELAYARQNKLDVATLQNKAGKLVQPSLEGIAAAAAGTEVFEDYRVSITDAAGPTAWPIAAFTYLLVYKDQADAKKGPALINLLKWALHDGQALAKPLDYGALPPALVARLDKTVAGITVQGKAAGAH